MLCGEDGGRMTSHTPWMFHFSPLALLLSILQRWTVNQLSSQLWQRNWYEMSKQELLPVVNSLLIKQTLQQVRSRTPQIWNKHEPQYAGYLTKNFIIFVLPCHQLSKKKKKKICKNKHSTSTPSSVPPLRKACLCLSVIMWLRSSHGEHCGVIERSPLRLRPRLGCVGGVLFHLLRRPVGDLPALQHRPPVSLHVVEQRHNDSWAHQQLIGEREHKH